MSYQSALDAINANIKFNGNEEITGVILNGVLVEMLGYARNVIGDEDDLINYANLIQAVENLSNEIGSIGAQDLDSVALEGNITSVKLVGSSLFENKATNDFAQIGDIQNAITGVNYFGSFDSVDDIELIDGNVGDFATLNFGVEQYLYQLTNVGWRAVNGLFISGLKVKKRPNNFDITRLEQYDYCEGWLSPTLFVNGLWKLDTATAPTQVQMLNINNWSNFIEIE